MTPEATYPRLAHLERHLSSRDHIETLPLLMLPGSLEDIAEAHGPGFTRRMVEYRFEGIRHRIPLGAGFGPSQLYRLALLRVAMGLDPCWCESRRMRRVA